MRALSAILTCITMVFATSCRETERNTVHLKDALIEHSNEVYKTYYDTKEIEVAERSLAKFIELAKEKKKDGAKAESILWEAYFRLAEIHKIEGREAQMRECMTESLKNLKELEDVFRPETGLEISYSIDHLKEYDKQKEGPKWKEGRSNLLF